MSLDLTDIRVLYFDKPNILVVYADIQDSQIAYMDTTFLNLQMYVPFKILETLFVLKEEHRDHRGLLDAKTFIVDNEEQSVQVSIRPSIVSLLNVLSNNVGSIDKDCKSEEDILNCLALSNQTLTGVEAKEMLAELLAREYSYCNTRVEYKNRLCVLSTLRLLSLI